nr:hypothetical protein [Chloroflexus sp.]
MVDFFVVGLLVDEVEHIDHWPTLAEAFNSPQPLGEPRGVPRQIDVDERAERL